MKNKETREIYFFNRLAKVLCADKEALDALKEYRSIGDIFRTLQDYGYLVGMTLDSYLEIALKAGDDLKYFLDPETGDFSDEAIASEEAAEFKESFLERRNLILQLLGRLHTPPRFPLIVPVENGKVRGSLERLHGVIQWFGVPYGAFAAGENRWKKPQPAPFIERVMNCTKPGEKNLQFLGDKSFGVEGRLTLNVCRPNSTKDKLPVMVYFHGGGFQIGSAEEWLGNKFCETIKAVHVGVEFRMGAFGFNPLPALHTGDTEEDSGNYALLDIIAALRWIQRNIKSFGGDPGNVTISGLSSGGRVAVLLMICPMARGLFHRIIAFSAGLTLTDPEPSRKIFAQKFALLAVEDHMRETQEEAEAWLLSETDEDRKTARNWLMGLAETRVISLFPMAGGRMADFPHLYRDGKVLPETGFDTPDLKSVPLLAFCSSDEFSVFTGVDSWFKQRYRDDPADEALDRDKELCTKYGSLLFRHFSSHQMAKGLYPHLKAPIYVGRFCYGHNAKNFSEEFVHRYGALHGVYLSFLSDQYKFPWKRGDDFFENFGAEYLGTQLFKYIEQFMQKGDPNFDDEETPWLAWTPTKQNELHFDGDHDIGYVKAEENKFNYEDVFAQYDADSSVSKESKTIIAKRVIGGRWFSREWDIHFGNPADPVLL
ncbi:MAG: carboxylesterase family protein [Anaerovibrio sp.]|uniref:carboxylesterase family protein n=1 Tax=Anaerovibrio sp. TaxID=1872532 RepID=UPI0025C467B9|nr:carboxylesterase family protein [Anaerovibrio sp.]MBE6100044.1 carboxylesterase family protein [Anaerovibrio sp.]